MVAGQASETLGGGCAVGVARGAPGTTRQCNDSAVADEAAATRLLDAGSVNELADWVDSLLGQPEMQSSALGSEQEARRHVAVKLKRLATLKRAVETLETSLRRQQVGLELELTPGLSDRYLNGKSRGESGRRRFPLSYAQQQMLALQQMHPRSSTYNVTRALRVATALPLDLDALQIALHTLLVKHEALRTLFELDPLSGEHQQAVLPAPDYPMDADGGQESTRTVLESLVHVVEWAGAMETYNDDRAMGEFIAAHTVSDTFDLTRELPVRLAAIRAPSSEMQGEERGHIDDAKYQWTIVAVLHHIATDGASSAIFWRDLLDAYVSASSPDRSDRRPETTTTSKGSMVQGSTVRYRDYAVWQRERVQSGAFDASIAYWCRLFGPRGDDNSTLAPALELPFDKKLALAGDSTDASSSGDVVKFRASDAAFTRMASLCQSHGCSLYMGLLAVFYMLLSRLSGGAADVTIGTPVSARDREDLQHVMGYFVNTLPLRIRQSDDRSRIDDTTTFAELLQVVRRVVLGAFAHREVPFHVILDRICASERQRQQTQRGNSDVSSFTALDGDSIGELRAHSLYQVMFALEQDDTAEADTLDSCGFGREVQLPHSTAKFDLMLTMRVVRQRQDGAGARLEGAMEFPLDKFNRSSIERFARYYCELLEQLTRLPDTPLRAVTMLPRNEQEQIVKTWGAPALVAAPSSTDGLPIGAFASPFIDECLGQQVRSTPSNLALHFDNGASWSYADLWRESSRVLNALHAISSCRDADDPNREDNNSQLRVGLFLVRGLANAAAIVGAMRARAVFVPLDASFPRERLRYMIRDADLHAVVTQRSHSAAVIELLTGISTGHHPSCESNGDDTGSAHVRVLTWEDLPLGGGDAGQQNLVTADPRADAPAYILYTSGSTGTPKGVVVSHGNLLTTLRWTIRAYDVTGDDVFLQSTSTTLDGSLTQLLSPLLAGGAAVITRDGGLHDLSYMRSLLSAPHPRAVTYCVFVPSYLSTLLDFHHQSDSSGAFCFPSTVKHVVVVGEAFPMELARKFYRLMLRHDGGSPKEDTPRTCLVNEYGPTEAAVTSTFFRLPLSSVVAVDGHVPASQVAESDTVPIGVPIDGRRALVLDASGRLVPPNVCGELFLGGAGVSTGGYWRRPELTTAAFRNPGQSDTLRPLLSDHEARWYRTGDVVKWLPDGNLVFIGRVDSQVKLRGQRVELNEVRNVLLRHDSVVDAEVQVVSPVQATSRSSGPRLVAFVILTSQWTSIHEQRRLGSDERSDFVAFLRDRLSLHMVPHEIYAVARWPRTPNGKLDVRALVSDASLSVDKLASSSCDSTSSSRTASPRTSTDREVESSDDERTASSLTARITRDLLVQIWRQVLELDGDQDSGWLSRSFFSLGGDSLAAIRAISLARARGIALTLDAFFTNSDVTDMALRASASTHVTSLSSHPLVPLNVASPRPIQSDGTPLTLFLVHCADGTVWKLLELASLLPFRVVGVQATGIQAEGSVEVMAARYWAEIRAMQPHGPYALGGFSFGCRVAHEVARLALHAGHELYPLTLLDGVPFYTSDGSSSRDVDVEAYITETFGGHRPRGEEAELFDQLAAQFRAHCAMEDAYRPFRRLESGVDASVEPSGPSALTAVVYKTDQWELDATAMRVAGVDMRAVAFPGATHLSLLRHPYVAQVARAIGDRLTGTSAGGERG